MQIAVGSNGNMYQLGSLKIEKLNNEYVRKELMS